MITAALLLTGVKITTMEAMEISVPKLFPAMSQQDPVAILEWYVQTGDVVQPGSNLLKVLAPGREYIIPTPPEVTALHRVVNITSVTVLMMGEWLLTLTPAMI